MSAIVFALYMWAAPNPKRPDERLAMPPMLSLLAYAEAARYDATPYPVDPEEMIAILIHEHGDRAPDRHDSEGDDGASLGLYQLTAEERREYNEAYGTEYRRADMSDPATNTALAAYAVHDYKRAHAEKRYCRGKSHTWWAHQKCTFVSRETCETRDRERTVRKLSGWRYPSQWL